MSTVMPIANATNITPPSILRVDGLNASAVVDPQERGSGSAALRLAPGPGGRRGRRMNQAAAPVGVSNVGGRDAAAEQVGDAGERCPVLRGEVGHGPAALEGKVEIAAARITADALTHGGIPSSVALFPRQGLATTHDDPARGAIPTGQVTTVPAVPDGPWDPIADPWHRARRRMSLRAGHTRR